jgi:hypothetical protein
MFGRNLRAAAFSQAQINNEAQKEWAALLEWPVNQVMHSVGNRA